MYVFVSYTRCVRKVSDLRLDYFFQMWRFCALRICSKRSDDQQRILRWSSEKIAWCREKKTTAFLFKRWLASSTRFIHRIHVPAHSSNLVQQFLAKHKIVQLHQPPYSLDIAHCDFWMFTKLIQSNATRELKAIPKSAFEDCFKMWKHRWERVVQSNGDYFEGCHGPDDKE